jgi:predicted dehydrogenase
MADVVKYGIIGCGQHALRSHVLPSKDIPELKLEALCDISQEALDKFEAAIGAPLRKYTSEKDILADTGIAAVLIGTPDEYHAKSLLAAVAAGKHVFCEKPLGTTAEDIKVIDRALRTAEKSGVLISSCHPRRLDPAYIWLKEHAQELEAEIGKPLEFRFDFSYHKPTRRWKHNRGLLIDHINHEIDLVNFIYGRKGFRATRLADEYDRYHAVGMRDDNLAFAFQGTRRLNEHRFLERASVRHERGDVTCEDGLITIYRHDTGDTRTERRPSDYEHRFRKVNENFARAVLGKEQSYLAPDDLLVNTLTGIHLTDRQTISYCYTAP